MSEYEDFVYGVDGCGDGRWVACRATCQGPREFRVFEDIDDLWKNARSARLILIDVPIGTSWSKRECDRRAKSLLSKWSARVYLIPHREVLAEPDQSRASAMNKERAAWGVSSQTWGICPQILGVDRFLAANPEATAVLRECHPEICFWSLNGQRVVGKRKDTPEGRTIRRDLLRRELPETGSLIDEAIMRLKGLAKPDDILDAAVAAWTAMASLVAPEQLRTLPEMPPRDERGLSMEMVYRLV